MKGLVKYDLMQLGSSLKGGVIILYLLFLGVISVLTTMGASYAYMIVFLCAAFGISEFSYEESYHWDRYMAALPVSTKKIVLARYASAFLLLCIGMVCSAVLLGIVMWKNNGAVPTGEYLSGILSCVALAVFYLELMIPIMYRFGAERGRIFMLAFCGVVIGGAFFAAEYLIHYLNADTFWKGFSVCAVIVVLLIPVSYSVSVKIRSKKEF